MKAVYNEKESLFSVVDYEGNPVPNAPRYSRFLMDVEWLDPSGQGDHAKNWLIFGGEREDGVFEILFEHAGSVETVGKEATNLKDRFDGGSGAIRLYYRDGEAVKQSVTDLRNHDGLRRYILTDTKRGDKILLNTERWPHFRDKNTHARLVPVFDHVIADPSGALDRFLGLKEARKVVFRQKTCPLLLSVIDLPDRAQVLKHPGVRAAAYLTLMFLATQKKPDSDKKTEKPRPVYGNFVPR